MYVYMYIYIYIYIDIYIYAGGVLRAPQLEVLLVHGVLQGLWSFFFVPFYFFRA